MKILAIRGKNLASLANEFEILLEEGPLKHAGLFAITGQTGAGKSTLLDALCLALYDKMPRLPKGTGVSIGHKDEDENTRISSHDVSSILRRGTASAYAEVDFIGCDKQHYRSRWEISRARNKINGRLQAQKITLTQLPSQEVIGHKKTETLEAIVEKIGLSFDQFRRSVLLAQGDFAAFLKAKKDERSSLLEKMTGTSIYSQLSIAAFERASKEKHACDKLKEKLSDKIPLAEEERRALEEQNVTLNAEQQQLNSAIKQTEQHLAWHKTQAELQQELTQLQQKNTQAIATWDSQSEHRLLLKQIDDVQILRPLLQQQEQLTEDCTKANDELSQHKQLLHDANEALPELEARTKSADDFFSLKQKSQQEAQPLLTQAQILDSQLHESAQRNSQFKSEYAQQKSQWETSQVTLATLQKQTHTLTKKCHTYTAWQEQHTQISPLINEWGRWKNDLKNLATTQQALKRYNAQQDQLAADSQNNKIELKQLNIHIAESTEKHNALQESAHQLELDYKENSLESCHQQRIAIEQEKQATDTALLSAEHFFALSNHLKQEQDNLAALQHNRQQHQETISDLEAQQTIINSQYNEAQQAFHLLQSANTQSVKQLRGALQQNEACSVCGSEDHPWAEINNPLQKPIAEQEKRVQQLGVQKDDHIKMLAKEGSFLTQCKSDLAACLSRQNVLISQQHALHLPSIPSQSIEHLKQQQSELNLRHLSAQENETQALALQKQWNYLRDKLAHSQQQNQQKNEKITQLKQQITLDSQLLKSLKKDVSRETSNKAELITALSEPLTLITDWQNALTEDSQFIHNLQSTVSEWQKTEQSKKETDASLVLIHQKLELAEAEGLQHFNIWEKIDAELQTHLSAHEKLAQDRQSYFSGKPAIEIAQQLEAELKAAELKKQNTIAQLNAHHLDIKTQQHSIKHWKTESSRRVKKQQQISDELDAALHKKNISRIILNELLSKSQSWLAAEKDQQESLKTNKQETQTVLAVKQQAINTHQINQPEQEKSDLQANLQQQQIEQTTLKNTKDSISFSLRSDDEKVKAGKELTKDLNKQMHIWEEWERLNDLIGSKSGQKFRVFAQGLTLETLLAYTNQHLQEFAKRYSLERVNNTDLELQVIDRDMADEIRSVHSLSGGESFLVSLALALGLASLSSNKMQVESLFIDEGFGSLDPETLDIAIASLDTLQSLGRKVAVISHVPALVERIGTQIRVDKVGGGHSVVSVLSNN